MVPELWKGLPALLDDVARALAPVDVEYVEFLTTERLMVTAAAQVALQELVEAAEQRMNEGFDEVPDGDSLTADETEELPDIAFALFEEAGRDHFRRDRPLRSLLYAYQTGGRVAWRHVSAIAVRMGFPADALAALAEGVFRAVDRISAVTTTGYLMEQTESAGMREQLRTALAEQLLIEGVDPAAIEDLARQAGWSLPQQAAVVYVRPDDQAGLTALARLGHRCLQIVSTTLPGAIVPDPGAPGARQRLITLLRNCSAVVGPTVPLRLLPESAQVTRDAAWALDLPIADGSPFFVDDHLDTIIVHRDERLLSALRARVLAPLDAAAPGSREAFRETLRSWLVHMGDRRAVAAELQVHPQTVRYRLSRLHELFGPVLEDPRGRLRLLLALAWDTPAVAAVPRSAPPRR